MSKPRYPTRANRCSDCGEPCALCECPDELALSPFEAEGDDGVARLELDFTEPSDECDIDEDEQ